MANYTITVNGKTYDVTVEKKASAAAPPAVAPAVPAPVAAAPAPAPAPAAPPTDAGDRAIIAPMPGKVIAVKVNVGDRVTKGQELLIVEAMKMHNPVLAANDGVVQKIFVKAGDPIQTGMPLIAVG